LLAKIDAETVRYTLAKRSVFIEKDDFCTQVYKISDSC
jgi:hypothetical protein